MNPEKKLPHKKLITMSFFIKGMWNYRKEFYVLFFAYVLLMAVQPLVSVFCPRYIIDEMSTSKNIERIVIIILFMVGMTFLVNSLVVLLDNQLSKVYYEDYNRLLEANIGKKCMELKYATTENKQTLDYINQAKLGINNGYSGGMNGFFKAFSLLTSNMCTLLVTLIVVIRYSWVLIVIVILNAAVSYLANHELNRIQLKQFEKLSSIDNAYYYLLHTLSDIRYGKDIRLFGAKRMMTDRADGFNVAQSKICKKQADESMPYFILSKADLALASILTYLVLASMALKQQITIGEFTMVATSVATLILALNNILKQILDLNKFNKYAEKYIDFIVKNEYEQTGNITCANVGRTEIEFRNVSFAYPNQTQFALRNINVKISDKEHWSVVGLNGAGKSTFIKLLCRLYECTEGEILLNGINILEYEYNSYMKQIAAIFQDFQLLNFSIKENIVVGDYDKASDETVMNLVERVGLKDKVESLKLGLATPVFRYYDMNGFEPSGGEQQKIAMARALYKNAPILVLDEPTAALDPIAEKEVYETFHEMTREKTAIFISHRLASCKFCEKILVFNGGEIVEEGTHESLIALQDGLYAKMFRTQEKYYA